MNPWFYVWHAIQWFVGIRSPAMAIFWGGFGSLSAVTGIFGVVYHHLNCHEEGCWRPGKFTTVEDNGHHFKRCKKHHVIRHERATDAVDDPEGSLPGDPGEDHRDLQLQAGVALQADNGGPG